MTMNKTNKILLLLLALLFISNLTTIGTILYHNRGHQDGNVAIVIDENAQNPLIGRFLRQELGFDSEQMAVFREVNRKLKHVANTLIYEMDSLKVEMFNELNKDTPDSLRLKELSNHIGMHHTELKEITNEYYLKLKSVCNETQREQLKEAFLPLFKDGTTTNVGRGYRRGQGPRDGRGRGVQ